MQRTNQQSVQISCAFQKKILTEAEAVKQIERVSKDYSYGETEIDPLINFIRTTFLDIGNITITPVTTEIGWSGNNVFWVRNAETSEIKLFLKVFNKDFKNFLSELYSLDYLQRVQGIASVELQALGKFDIDGRCHFVIAETPAKGHSFQHYYNNMAKHSIGSPERRKALQTLLEGVRICGTALANLHMHVKGQAVSLPEEIEKAMRINLERVISKLTVFPQKGVEINKLIKYVEISIEKMKSELHLTGVTHGDIKLIHAFYHPGNQQISLIDSSELITSIDPDNNPKGLPIKDYYAFVRSLFLNRFGYSLDAGRQPYKQELLTIEEASSVISIFQNSYKAAGDLLYYGILEPFTGTNTRTKIGPIKAVQK